MEPAVRETDEYQGAPQIENQGANEEEEKEQEKKKKDNKKKNKKH